MYKRQNLEDQGLFQRFLDGEISQNDLAFFEERMESDQKFKKDFELYKDMNSYLGEKEVHGDALEKLRSYNPSEVKQVLKSKSKFWIFILLAAMLGALLLAWNYFNKSSGGTSSEQLYASYFQPEEASLFTRGCLLYTSPSPRDATLSRMPSSA